MAKRLTISLLLCVVAFAIVSNRMVWLQRLALAAESTTTNVHQPIDHPSGSGFIGKFLVPEALQDEFKLQKLAPASIRTAVELFSDSWHRPWLESITSPKPPQYIVLSVLNL